jgi:hypothetical protein
VSTIPHSGIGVDGVEDHVDQHFTQLGGRRPYTIAFEADLQITVMLDVRKPRANYSNVDA